MKVLLLIFIVMLSWSVEALAKREGTNEVEPRGKAKYALITNLAIVLAAKVGLYKLILAIALTIASVKILLMMVWALTISKHVPDPYLDYKKSEHYAPFQHLGPYHDNYVHFFYVVATKLIVLKMVYGALFYILITKAWHFLLWFIHYLKKHKHHHEYIEDHHFEHYDHHDHGHFDHSYGNFDDHSYGTFDHQPYVYDTYGYGSDKKRIYDADGSYAVKGQSG